MELFARRDSLDSRTTFTVAKWIEDTLLFMRRRMAEDRIDMIIECAPDLFVTGNRVQLESVLYELLTNAREAFPVSSRNRKIRIRAEPGPKATVTVEIRDNAGGIPSEALGWIFEPFFSTKKGQGAGLGLAMSRRILGEHGGSLECVSANGETAFEIRLPVLFPAQVGGGRDRV
jgi:C4-dicarboxylate-specific signal transduction histidine kinase